MICVYIAHEYGGKPKNRVAASKWCAFFADLGYNPSAMWIVLTGEWDESRIEQGLAIDFDAIERADVMVQVGNYVSAGMEQEEHHAKLVGTPVVNLTNGNAPPTPECVPQEILKYIIRRINSAVRTDRTSTLERRL